MLLITLGRKEGGERKEEVSERSTSASSTRAALVAPSLPGILQKNCEDRHQAGFSFALHLLQLSTPVLRECKASSVARGRQEGQQV